MELISGQNPNAGNWPSSLNEGRTGGRSAQDSSAEAIGFGGNPNLPSGLPGFSPGARLGLGGMENGNAVSFSTKGAGVPGILSNGVLPGYSGSSNIDSSKPISEDQLKNLKKSQKLKKAGFTPEQIKFMTENDVPADQFILLKKLGKIKTDSKFVLVEGNDSKSKIEIL